MVKIICRIILLYIFILGTLFYYFIMIKKGSYQESRINSGKKIFQCGWTWLNLVIELADTWLNEERGKKNHEYFSGGMTYISVTPIPK